MFRCIALSLMLAVMVTAATAEEYFPFRNISLSLMDRVSDLVDRLTLEEMIQVMAVGGSADLSPNPGIPRLGIPPYQFNTDCMRGVTDMPSTSFPQSVGLAATFSPDLIKMMATVIGTEARAIYRDASSRGDYSPGTGINCYSPVLNILRHPLWGRAQETYGEDPFLTGSMAQAYVSGLQGDHPRYVRVGAGCKHFAAHSGPENLPSSRFSFNAIVSERDLRLTFLPQFKRCVEAGTLNMMCSYNSINGVPACANKRFVTDIARTEWGFKGFFISDNGALDFIYPQHHYTNSSYFSAVVAANAGVNMDLPWTTSSIYLNLYAAVYNGSIEDKTVRDLVAGIFYARMWLGMFDPPALNPYANIPMSVVQSAAHRQLALAAAIKSFVLLKNVGETLPVAHGSIKNLAIIGPMADNVSPLFGDYTAKINMTYTTTPYRGLLPAASTVLLVPGCEEGNACPSYNSSLVVNATLAADLVIVCLGVGYQFEEEDTDRGSLALPGLQIKLLLDVITYAKRPIILLIFSGGPVDLSLPKYSLNVGAIIQCFYPAQATGEALLQVLFTSPPGGLGRGGRRGGATRGRGPGGEATSPAGRSPYTWPLNLTQVPPMVNYSMEGRTYRYFAGPGAPLYPFGYGLSYSVFKYTDLVISPLVVREGDNVSVSVNVHNLGPYDCDEVTQVYVSWRAAPVRMPNIQLVAVTRSLVLFGAQPLPLTLSFSADQLKIWDDLRGFVFYTATIDVYVGGQQPFQEDDVGSNILSGKVQTTASA